MRGVTEHGYTTYPRRFEGYAWYKPLLVGLVFAVLYLILSLPKPEISLKTLCNEILILLIKSYLILTMSMFF